MNEFEKEKFLFLTELKTLAKDLADFITQDGNWTMRGFIDVFKNIYTLSTDTKIVSKVLELHLFPYFLDFANRTGYEIELAGYQNYYPDLTFVSRSDPAVKFAVDLKTTYRLEDYPEFCNGFTLGSHGQYFIDRTSNKNIRYPYADYKGHFCFGIIYARAVPAAINETKKYSIEQIQEMPVILKNFIFFAEEKWRIASDKHGSGNTANIGSIEKIDDILSGNGVFCMAGEQHFDEYWCNYGKMVVNDLKTGEPKKLSSFPEYLKFRGLPSELYTPKATKRNMNNGE